MRYFQLLFFFFIGLSIHALGQVANDECTTGINLGAAPICQPNVRFTNVGATTSNIGNNNSPSCFAGGTTQRDVWFRFTTTAGIQNYIIRVDGVRGTNNPLTNPQVTLYRGTCNVLSELQCVSAENGQRSVSLQVNNLPANQQFFIRVNDYTASATPNAGDFSLCIEEFVPPFIMGSATGSTACSGTLFDSGGPDGNYQNNEDFTFTICPSLPHTCIQMEIVNYDMEFGFDILSLYAGDNVEAPLIARITGANLGTPFPIQASSNCVTARFVSDFATRRPGFELKWRCNTAGCARTSIEQATVVNNLPFSASLTSCGTPATFAQTACGTDIFLNGPEKVLVFNSPGGICATIAVTNAQPNTGILVLDAPPSDPNANCIAKSTSGFLRSVNFETRGTYYIIVAQPLGCTNFDISIQESDCTLSPALLDALCNPLNGCLAVDGGLPSLFVFQDGFKDVQLREGVNSGCWQNEGLQADFFWFTIQAQANGKFGFILESADVPSDIDFNVWGPFTSNQVCNDKASVVRFIERNQPIRSSWAPNTGRTGLADTHPIFRYRVTDNFDCLTPLLPSPFGDDFVRTIDAQEGQVYVVLINDFGNDIQNNGILVDWSPSLPEVLARIPVTSLVENVEICRGESAQLLLSPGLDNIVWSPSESLSCANCLNPIASPTETTIYKAIVSSVCTQDTISVEVKVLGVEAGPDVTICLGESFQVNAGSDFVGATYEWIAPPQVVLSCTDCPNPIITSSVAGTYTITVRLNNPDCPTSDEFRLTVLSQPAPQFEVADDAQLCLGDSLFLGSNNNSTNLTYTWRSIPEGFTSNDRTPQVTPTQTTKYFVSVGNGICPIASLDSVLVEVFTPPVFQILQDTTICQNETLTLSFSQAENGVTYLWSGADTRDFNDVNQLNTTARPQNSGAYRLTATRGACEVTQNVQINVIPAAITFVPEIMDTVLLCKGTSVELRLDSLRTRPSTVQPTWLPDNGSLSSTVGLSVTASPSQITKYFVQIENQGCIAIDSVVVRVDSLPLDLSIMPADTVICEGEFVILTSSIYEPFEFPNIKFEWTPSEGQQTPDSLFNLVVTPDTTRFYFRKTTNGVCVSNDSARIEVNPLPEIEILPQDAQICPGSNGVNLTINSLNNVPIDPESYMWTPMEGLSCTDCPNPTALLGGAYNVQVMSDKMCPGAASVTVQSIEPPAISPPANTIICPGETVRLNTAVTPRATYVWTSTDPTFGTVTTPTPVVSPTVTSTYTVRAQNGECPAVETSITIQVLGEQEIRVTGNPTYCQGESTTLTLESPVAGNTAWRVLGSTAVISTNRSITINNTETTTYEVTFSYACGILTQRVTVTPEATVLISNLIARNATNQVIDTVFVGTTVFLEAELGTNLGNATIEWFANGVNIDSGERTTSDEAAEAGITQYQVRVTTPNGCRTTRNISIVVLPVAFEIPNAFSPNGDQRNDVFRVLYPQGLEIESFDMKIFSRWGNLVFQSSNINIGWDGTKDGKGDTELASDVYVYYYTIRLRDVQEVFSGKGDVTLIR